MKRLETAIPDLVLIEPDVYGDSRGFFMETYQVEKMAALGVHESFVQDNHSRSAKGVLRGMHYQLQPYTQGKLMRVVTGAIFDVAVDCRPLSPTYKQWFGTELNESNHHMMYIPPGFGHGFYVLSDHADVEYKTTSLYAPEYDRGFRWDDPEIDIIWPEGDKILSEKDRHQPDFLLAEMNF